MVRTWAQALSVSVWSIWSLWLVSYNQTNQTDQINKRDLPVLVFHAPPLVLLR
jgi:hypothetical protein